MVVVEVEVFDFGVLLDLVEAEALDPAEGFACASAAFSALRAAGASESLGASTRNFLYAAISVFESPASWAAWASASWVLASLGSSLPSFL